MAADPNLTDLLETRTHIGGFDVGTQIWTELNLGATGGSTGADPDDPCDDYLGIPLDPGGDITTYGISGEPWGNVRSWASGGFDISAGLFGIDSFDLGGADPTHVNPNCISSELEVSIPGCTLTANVSTGTGILVTGSGTNHIIVEMLNNIPTASLVVTLNTEVWRTLSNGIKEYIVGGTVEFAGITITVTKDATNWTADTTDISHGVYAQRNIEQVRAQDIAEALPWYQAFFVPFVGPVAGYVRYFDPSIGADRNNYILYHKKYDITAINTKLCFVSGFNWTPGTGFTFSNLEVRDDGLTYRKYTGVSCGGNEDGSSYDGDYTNYASCYLEGTSGEFAAWKNGEHPHTSYVEAGGNLAVKPSDMTVNVCGGDDVILCGDDTWDGSGYRSSLRSIAYNSHPGYYQHNGYDGSLSDLNDIDFQAVLDRHDDKAKNGVDAAWNTAKDRNYLFHAHEDDNLYLREYQLGSVGAVQSLATSYVLKAGSKPSIVSLPNNEFQLAYATSPSPSTWKLWTSRWSATLGERDVLEIGPGKRVVHCRDAKGRFIYIVGTGSQWYAKVGTLNSDKRTISLSSAVTITSDVNEYTGDVLADGNTIQFIRSTAGNVVQLLTCKNLGSDAVGTWTSQNIGTGRMAAFCRDSKGRLVFMMWTTTQWYVRVATLQADKKTLSVSAGTTVVMDSNDSVASLKSMPDGSFQFIRANAAGAIQILTCKNLKSDGTGTWA